MQLGARVMGAREHGFEGRHLDVAADEVLEPSRDLDRSAFCLAAQPIHLRDGGGDEALFMKTHLVEPRHLGLGAEDIELASEAGGIAGAGELLDVRSRAALVLDDRDVLAGEEQVGERLPQRVGDGQGNRPGRVLRQIGLPRAHVAPQLPLSREGQLLGETDARPGVGSAAREPGIALFVAERDHRIGKRSRGCDPRDGGRRAFPRRPEVRVPGEGLLEKGFDRRVSREREQILTAGRRRGHDEGKEEDGQGTANERRKRKKPLEPPRRKNAGNSVRPS